MRSETVHEACSEVRVVSQLGSDASWRRQGCCYCVMGKGCGAAVAWFCLMRASGGRLPTATEKRQREGGWRGLPRGPHRLVHTRRAPGEGGVGRARLGGLLVRRRQCGSGGKAPPWPVKPSLGWDTEGAGQQLPRAGRQPAAAHAASTGKRRPGLGWGAAGNRDRPGALFRFVCG